MSRRVGHRHGSDPALLWLCRRPAATALIRPLAWEPPYVSGAALEKTKRQKKKITYMQYPITNHNGKECEREYEYVHLNHFCSIAEINTTL